VIEGEITMAYAQRLTSDIIGYFIEKDYSRPFEYMANTDMYSSKYPHLVYVGPHGSETRYARVKKTVVYVAVDEASDGSFVEEKWFIKKHTQYKR
jgi:hypothetical protein